MKLLVDENLSVQLVPFFEPHFPGTCHVKQLHCEQTDDTDLWCYAKENGFSIISKDKDFQQMGVFRGAPPKVIWLRMGNNPARRVLELLDRELPAIKHFMGHPNRSLLILEP